MRDLGDDPSDLCQEKMGTSEWEGGFQIADRVAFTVSPDLRIQVSDRAHGTHGFDEWLGAYHGKALRPPQRPSYYPEPVFVAWHVREVFQGEARYGGST